MVHSIFHLTSVFNFHSRFCATLKRRQRHSPTQRSTSNKVYFCSWTCAQYYKDLSDVKDSQLHTYVPIIIYKEKQYNNCKITFKRNLSYKEAIKYMSHRFYHG